MLARAHLLALSCSLQVFVELNLPQAVIDDPVYFGGTKEGTQLFSCRAARCITERLKRCESLLKAGGVSVAEDAEVNTVLLPSLPIVSAFRVSIAF